MRRWTILIYALALLGAGSAAAQAPYSRADSLKTVVPGQVYREYAITMASGNDWRVTDPNATSPGSPGNTPATYLPNPVLSLPVGDLQGAVRAVAVIDVWGGHVGTTGKRFRVNGNAWISIPDIANTASAPECYTQQVSVPVEIPLAHLTQGLNTLEGTSGGQTCFNINWGQWGWYGFLLRVYYDPQQKSAPTGAITLPVTGATLGDFAEFEASASSTAGISRVEFVGRYENHDPDGDGVFLDWQQSYHWLQGDANVTLRDHIGTAESAPYRVGWDTQWIPDQVPGGIAVVARIRDTDGLWSVTERVTGLTLDRPDINVRMYRATDYPRNYLVREELTISTNFTIPPTHGLAFAQSARMIVATWNGLDGGRLPGEDRWTQVNGWTTPAFGADHAYSIDPVGIPLYVLQNGANAVTSYSGSSAHGAEILWPGPVVIVRYAGLATAPATVVVQPADVRTVEGIAATFSVVAIGGSPVSYQWQRNGMDIPGATTASYTTGAPTFADNGDRYRCRVTNADGFSLSDEAILTVPAIGPRSTNGQIILYTFAEAGGDTIHDLSGVGVPADLIIPASAPVSWRPGAVSVDAPTSLATAAPPTKLIEAVKASNEVSIEAWLKPGNLTQTGPARIVTLSSGTTGSNFTLGQGQFGSASTLYDVRLRATGTSTSGTPSLGTAPGTLATRLTHVVFTRDVAGVTSIFIDGILAASGVAAGDLSNWDDSFRLFLANEATGDRPWLGEYHLVAIFDRALSGADVLQNYTAGPSANNLPTADFSAAPLEGTAPLTVDFDASGSLGGAGPVVAWNWSFGDGAQGAGEVTSHQYTASGAFLAELTVTNIDGGMASTRATIVVFGPPVVSTHPTGRTVKIGRTATFNVLATGTPPISYQWQKNGIDIPGAVEPFYTTPPVQPEDDGAAYRCLATNPHGTAVSNEAILTVPPAPPRVGDGLLALYTFREGAGDAVNDVSGIGEPLNLVIADTNAVDWRASGLNVASTTLIASVGAAAKINTGAQAADAVTFEAWITPANATQMGPARIISLAQDGSNRNFMLGQGLYGTLPSTLLNTRMRTTATDLDGVPGLSTPEGSLAAQMTHVVYTRDAAGTARIYLDGVPSAAAAIGGDLSNWNPDYRLGLANEIGAARPWLGEFHLVAVYGAALSAEQVLQNYEAGARPRPNGNPVARATATPTAGLAPLNVAFSAALSTDDDGTLVAWDWDFGDGFTASGDTVSHRYGPGRFTATLTVFDNAGGTATVSFPITVSRPHGIIRHPVDQLVSEGQTATFGLLKAGPASGYQWQKNNVDIPGATDSTYTTPPVVVNDDGTTYRCVVSDAEGHVSSEAATLSVRSAGGPALPTVFALGSNYPNPFNPATTISFDLPLKSVVNLRIYDLSGRLVDHLLNGETVGPGRMNAVWRGCDLDGRPVAAGVYLYRLEAGGFSATKRMLLLK